MYGVRSTREPRPWNLQNLSAKTLKTLIVDDESLARRGKDAGELVNKEPSRLAIRDGGRTTWVDQQDIERIDAAGDYMCVQSKGKTYIMRKTMKKLEKELDGSILQRIHRSTIVNIRQVREMEAHINGEYFLTLESGHRVKLSRTYKNKLKLFR